MKKNEKRPLTPQDEALKAYNSKIKIEAVIKSLLWGLSIGFLLGAIISIVSFATSFNTLWIALGVFAASTVGFTVLFYFKRYRPDVKKTAERVDGIGLEERVVTMMQFKDSDNPMLNRQREDAHTALKTVSTKQMKMRFPLVLIIALVVVALVSVFMMSYSTVLAVNAEAQQDVPPVVDDNLSDEDKIIRDMIKALRDEIDSAKISDELRGQLHGLVDDLEASLKPEDSLEMKVAKIMDTADKIHKLIEDYLNRSTIAEELMKYDTTYELGKAIDSKDVDKIREAFKKMYESIAPLVDQAKFDLIFQTAMDIDTALNDAINTPPELQKALEDLRDALLSVLPPPPEEDGEEPKTNDEINQELQDAFKDAMDALEDFFDQQETLDDNLQDIFKDAMEQLGQEFEYPENPKEEEKDPDQDKDEDGKKPEMGGDESGNPSPNPDDGSLKDTVIDGQTSYKDLFDKGYADELRELLESGTLTDEERQLIQDYLDSLS